MVFVAAATLGLAVPASANPTAIVGATVIDVSNFGRSDADIPNAAVVLNGGKIETVGDRAHVAIPKDATIIHAEGRYLIPGLIDGFASQRTAGFARANLYEGVTTIFVMMAPDGEDGESVIVHDAREPDIRTGSHIGGYSPTGVMPSAHPWTEHRLHDVRLSNDALVHAVDAAADAGRSAIMIGHDVWPDQMDIIVAQAKHRHLTTLAEPAFTTYPYAIRAGVDVLLRADRYQSALAPAWDWLAYSDDPEGPGGGPAIRAPCKSADTDPQLIAYANQLAHSGTALMPALSMEATADGLDTPNPWSLPGAKFVTAKDLDDPVDPQTNARPYLAAHPDRKAQLQACALRREANDGFFHRAGAHYLAGSTAPGFGIMPGSGLHQELKLFQRIGLSPREALATATSNVSDVFGWSDIGRVEAGRVANLVLLKSDPRKDIGAVDDIDVVILKGSVVNREALLPKKG
jgi:hypothetical protein